MEEVVETAVVAEEVEVKQPANLQTKLGQEGPSTQTFQLERLAIARCISVGVGELFSARIRAPAPGETSSLQSLPNETRTNSALYKNLILL